jgi:hypothetical protein
MRHKLLIVAALSLLTALSSACAPEFGDNCSSSIECSATGDRFCDQSQPGGYCTLSNCEPKSCSDEGVCVRFKPAQPRLSSSWCMRKCGKTGDCRDDYVCRSAAELGKTDPTTPQEDVGTDAPTGLDDQPLAFVLDAKKNQKFCVVKE